MKFKYKNLKTPFMRGMLIIGFLNILVLSSCEKYLDIALPTDQVTSEGAFITDNSTSAIVTGIFFSMYAGNVFSGGESIGYRAGLYTDELKTLSTGSSDIAFYQNGIQSPMATQWSSLYKLLYQTNLAIEGIRASTSPLTNRNQWLGEALISRATFYYYLVNLFGDVPLTTKSNILENNILSRTPKAEVYKQIIADLTEAQTLLDVNYKDGFSLPTTGRARPNKYAATAFLARVYLELGDWPNAEAQSTLVINNTAAYQLVAPNVAFLAASKETIWALAPTGSGFVREYTLYNNRMTLAPSVIEGQVTSFVVTTLSDALLATFETNPTTLTDDLRKTNWTRTLTTIPATTGTTTIPGRTYYFPDKYKVNTPGTEFIVLMRLAEQYLIRAEARAQQNKLTGTNGATADLDAIRTRAGLLGTTAVSQPDILNAIMKERRVELFTEFGFRFIDLKRTTKIDAVMNVVAPLKGGTWSSYKQIWPIPTADIETNRRLTQAPEYQ